MTTNGGNLGHDEIDPFTISKPCKVLDQMVMVNLSLEIHLILTMGKEQGTCILPLGEISPKKQKDADRHGCVQRHVSVLTTCCVLGFCWLGFSRVCKSDVSRGLELIDDNGDDEDQCVSVVVGGVL
jgi:hypothetical protein